MSILTTSKSIRRYIFLSVATTVGLLMGDSAFEAIAAEEEERLDVFPAVRAEKVADGFAMPLGIIPYPGIETRLVVVEQGGLVKLLDLKPGETPSVVSGPFMDLRDRLVAGGEKGLLGIAFHPEFKRNGKIYVNYTAKDPNLKTVIAEYKFSPAVGRVDEKSERRLLTIDQPFENHNGGQIAFGPDGYLYIGMGDGGAAFDPQFNGQSKKTLLGKMLRIDVAPSEGYNVPKDNPFVGVRDAKGEIWALGLRNPWRFSFDSKTGDLWAADVGQNKQEEINIITRAGNYGWNILEGTNCLSTRYQCVDPSLIPPLFTYGRDQGFSITGGYVYRGSRIPTLQGAYIFGDFGSGRIWGLRRGKSGTRIIVETKQLLQVGMAISSFGVDHEGEIFIADHRNGAIHKLVPG